MSILLRFFILIVVVRISLYRLFYSRLFLWRHLLSLFCQNRRSYLYTLTLQQDVVEVLVINSLGLHFLGVYLKSNIASRSFQNSQLCLHATYLLRQHVLKGSSILVWILAEVNNKKSFLTLVVQNGFPISVKNHL